MPHKPITPTTPFGHRLAAICQARGLTLTALSLKSGWSPSRSGQLLRTLQPNRETIERLAVVLGVDRSELDPDLTPSNRE